MTMMCDNAAMSRCKEVECAESSRTLGIIHEFRRLYEDKMRILESDGSGDCNLHAKLSLQQDWIRDLNEQNEMLVRAVEELEQEATERVIALEDKLRQSSKCACEVMNGYKYLSNAFQQVDALQEDVCALVAFIRNSATTQKWDFDGLSLRTIDLSEILNKSDQSPTRSTIDQMQQEIATKDKNLKMLQQKLDDALHSKQMMAAEIQRDCHKCEQLRKSMMDVRDALTAEVADKHDALLSLKRDVHVLEEQCKKADQQTHFKDDIIKELRKEVKLLKSEVEEITKNQTRCIESENVQLRAAIKKATIQLEILEKSPDLYNENSNLKQQHENALMTISKLEDDKEKLKMLINNQRIDSARKVTTLETMLVECRSKPCTSRAQQTSIPQSCVACATEESETSNKCVGKCMKKSEASCASIQTNNYGTQKNFHDQETVCDCESLQMEETSIKALQALKLEEAKLEEVMHGLQSSVSKMIVSECQVKQDKCRIAELEMQLTCAWRTRDCEVEAARTCREQEIVNLNKVIDNLVKNLDTEKQRNDNLQKAVDMYHNSIDCIKESENNFKQEILGQTKTIQNLQDALIQTKQKLEDLQGKSNVECQEHSCLVEKLITIVTATEKELQGYVIQCEEFTRLVDNLREENIKLEETLFYNYQDLEMYEMRLAKYQRLYNQVEAQCGTLTTKLQALEIQKSEKNTFVHDLSENLSECQLQLADLFNVLNEEKHEKEDQSEQIHQQQVQLGVISQKLEITLANLEKEREQSAKLSRCLKKNQCATIKIKNEASLAHSKLQHAAAKIASDEQRILVFVQQIADHQNSVDALVNGQRSLKRKLEIAELQLNNRCQECAKFNQHISEIRRQHEDEIIQYQNTVQNLDDQLAKKDCECKKYCDDLETTKNRILELDRTESKLKQDLIDCETKYHTQINKYHSEQERLIAVVTNLERELSMMNCQLAERDHVLDVLKQNYESQQINSKQLREKYEESIHLKNEINTLIQTQVMVKTENEKLEMQLGHMRASLADNDEKHKRIINELEACLSDLHNDKDFLVRKNEQLLSKVQSLQDLCNAKAESLVALELELTDAKFSRDSLCNESKQVIDHVKCWLEEQRKINVELNEQIKHKNEVIVKLKEDKKGLTNKLKQCTTSNLDTSVNKSGGREDKYTMKVLHSSPPPRRGWSLASVDSAPCSLVDDSDWDVENADECPQIWIQRVECLTEELQRCNSFWKSKITEVDYAVSRETYK